MRWLKYWSFSFSKIGNLLFLSYLDVKGNHFEILPPELGDCRALKRAGLVVEDALFETLPSDVREQARGRGPGPVSGPSLSQLSRHLLPAPKGTQTPPGAQMVSSPPAAPQSSGSK